jgi:aspartyl-tRNA(Asn)/glutamyl-tRNA(Gln) amidotransferase subunit C
LSLSHDQVLHIARLARIGLDDSEVDHFAEQLSQVLEYFERLGEVDTTDVPPTAHTLALHNIWREDETGPCLDPQEALANAPRREDDLFRVKVILEE